MRLRDYQEDAIDALQRSYSKRKKAPLFVCATGSGKTVILAEIAKRLEARGTRSCIIVHRQELVEQTFRALSKAGIGYGIISPHYAPNDSASVQVASIQTLTRRFGKVAPFNFLLLDEAHHAAASNWKSVIAEYPNAKLLGVTATPCRLDGAPLENIFDDLIEGPPISELVERGFLTTAKVYAPPSDVDYKKLHLDKGDFNAAEVETLVNSTALIGGAVSHYRKLCHGQPAIAFCVSVDHARNVAESFCKEGYKAVAVSGSDTQQHRKAAIKGLATGSVEVLTSCSIISEGTDIPRATAAILLRPTMSLSLYLQMVGRVLRPVYAPGMPIETEEDRIAAIAASEKPHAFILDHCGNVARHGIHMDEREWSLTHRQKRTRKEGAMADGTRVCPECSAVSASKPNCTECGHAFAVSAKRSFIEVDGELVEFDATERKGEALVYQTLKEIAAIKGYKPGWAFHMQKSRRENRHFAPVHKDYAALLGYRPLIQYVTGKAPQKAGSDA